MNFTPSYQLNILSEQEFPEKIKEISENLSRYEVKGTLTSVGDLEISYTYYKTENAKANIVILHGFTEFSVKYHEMIFMYLNMGYNVFIYDQRGHGYSGRQVEDLTLAYVESFRQYVDDLKTIIDKVVKPSGDGLPIYIFSHSMGGAVASIYIMENRGVVKKAVLSSPMVVPITAGIPSAVVSFAAKKEGKKHSWSDQFKYTKNSSSNPSADTSVSEALKLSRVRHTALLHAGDKHYQNSRLTNRWIYEALSVRKILLKKKNARKIDIPVLVICAEGDTVVKNEKVERFSRMLPNAALVTMKEAKHTIFTGTSECLEDYMSRILAFFG